MVRRFLGRNWTELDFLYRCFTTFCPLKEHFLYQRKRFCSGGRHSQSELTEVQPFDSSHSVYHIIVFVRFTFGGFRLGLGSFLGEDWWGEVVCIMGSVNLGTLNCREKVVQKYFNKLRSVSCFQQRPAGCLWKFPSRVYSSGGRFLFFLPGASQ